MHTNLNKHLFSHFILKISCVVMSLSFLLLFAIMTVIVHHYELFQQIVKEHGVTSVWWGPK